MVQMEAVLPKGMSWRAQMSLPLSMPLYISAERSGSTRTSWVTFRSTLLRSPTTLRQYLNCFSQAANISSKSLNRVKSPVGMPASSPFFMLTPLWRNRSKMTVMMVMGTGPVRLLPARLASKQPVMA